MNDSAELVLDGSGPIWRQIERQIRRLIVCGHLLPGDELPSVRALAVALAVSPRAVERAYDRLERAALVTRADGSAPPSRPEPPPQRLGLRAGDHQQRRADHLRDPHVRPSGAIPRGCFPPVTSSPTA